MEDLRKQQKEALFALTEYSPRLITAIRNVAEELNGNRQPDTDEYLRSIVNGMNWEIEVFNGTRDYINEDRTRIDKDRANEIFMQFNEAHQGGNDAKMVELLTGDILIFFEELEAAAKELS